MSSILKTEIATLVAYLDHGDRMLIADRLRGNVSQPDVYNILAGRSLRDTHRTSCVLDELRTFVENKKRRYGI